MFPPIEDSVLRGNPKFAALHANLTTNILNPSGSTKHHPLHKEWDAVKEELRTERIRTAKRRLILNAVRNLDVSVPTSTSTSKPSKSSTSQSSKQQTLPPELVEIILLLSSHLNGPSLDPTAQALLQTTQQWVSLPNSLPQVSSLLSNHIQTQALLLARIVSPTTNASYLHRTVPKLVPNLRDLKTNTDLHKLDLAKRRTALVTLTTRVLAQYHHATSLTISHLEQNTHGLLSRHLKSKADFLSLHAVSVSLLVKEKQTKANKIVYTEKVKQALGVYMQHLRLERERLRERGEDAKRVLWGYGVGREDGEKEKVMREVARVYTVLKGEVEEVGRDVGRLRGK